MMLQINKAVEPGQVCLTSVNRYKTAAAGGSPGGCLRNRNLVNVVGKSKLGGNIFISSPSQLVVAPTTPIERRRLMATSNANADIANNSLWPSIPSSSYGDPCLDLFFNALRPEWRDANPCLTYLEQLLPLASSHNPLTTLKLIFTFDSIDFSDTKFDTAVLWLHHNHPKTLLRNLHSIANLPLVRYQSSSKGDGLVRKEDFQEEAKLQWKAMVEEIKQGEGLGKFKNCLVVGYGGLGYKEWSYPEVGWKFWCLK
ncbi:unnamed protein product [Prunus armeniaca]